MLRNRMLIVVGGCLLGASAAWADGVGYIDCSSHPEGTPVFGKPRRTPESVAALPCGERFTILLNGFIFSRIQTKDGQVGYIYSNLITPDHSGATVVQPASTRPPVAAPNRPATTATVAQPAPTAPVQVQAASAASVPPAAAPVQAPAPATAAKLPDAAAVAAQTYSAPNAQPESAPASVASTSTTNSAETPETTIPTAPSVPASATAPAQAVGSLAAAAAPAQTEASAQPVESKEAVTATQPEAAPTARPENAPAEAAAPATPNVRSVNMKESWEKPNPVARTIGTRNVGMPRLPLIELFGGYGYARLDNGGGYVANSNGLLGSFGWNIKPWLQLVADSSYNRVTVSGTKNVLYGNHWGVRYFRRLRHSWGAAPFVEGLVGGSRADTTVSGTGGYSTSNIGMSYKIGGGVDIHPLRHFEIRVVDFDYYRTSFGTNLHQNNYFISTGIVMRLFGRSEE
jgi:hypothetical protein